MLIIVVSSESGHERITNRNSETCDVHVIELEVVVHNVVVGFGTDKRMSPEVVPYVAADVECEVVAALIIGTTTKCAAREIRRVEPQIFASNTGHGVSANLFLERLADDRVKVVEDGAVGLKDERAGV